MDTELKREARINLDSHGGLAGAGGASAGRRAALNGAVLTRPWRPHPGLDVTLQAGNWVFMDFSVL